MAKRFRMSAALDVDDLLLECIPYIATIAAMAVYNAIARRRAKAAKL